jgi:hypothetical protein
MAGTVTISCDERPAMRDKQMNQGRMRRIATLLVAAAFGLLASGLDPDAMQYMGAAESLAAHGDYRVPVAGWESADSTSALAHFPPGYSTALAIPVRLGMAPPQAARLVQALAAAITVATVTLLVGAATTPVAGAILGIALLLMDALQEVHLSVLSEPLFLACTALTLAAMMRRPTSPLRLGIPAALGALTRYAGLSLVGAATLWSFVERGTIRTRLRRTMLTLLPALLLQGAWVVRTRRVAGPATIRHFALYGGMGATLRHGLETLRDWLVPDPDAATEPIPYRARIALAAAFVLLTIVITGARRAWAMRREERERSAPSDSSAAAPARLLAACTVLIACYLAMLLVSRLIADPGIPLDNRLLSPVFLVESVIIATTFALWWERRVRDAGGALVRIAVASALLGWCASSAAVALDDASYARTWGSDFAGEQWTRSALLEWGRTTGAGYPLYSNWPSAVYFHLHRPAHGLPSSDDSRLLAAFADTLRARGGRVLAFRIPERNVVGLERLREVKGLRVVAELEDGEVFAAR